MGVAYAGPRIRKVHWRRHRRDQLAAIIYEPHPSGSLAAVATSERTGLGNVWQPCSGGFGFRHVGRDRVHQRRRQAVIGLEPDFLQPRADAGHLLRLHARFDH